jgi:hypothetical protein
MAVTICDRLFRMMLVLAAALALAACSGGGGENTCYDQGACSHNGTCRDGADPVSCECFEGRYEGEKCESCSSGYGWFEGVCAAGEGRRAAPDRGYEWYRTQMGTGRYEENNCGPASVSMAMKWFEESLDVDPGAVREAVTPVLDGWWYTTDIENALGEYGVPYAIEPFDSVESALAELDAGYILILCLTMGAISRQVPPYTSHFNRFYAYDSGHFVVVKGYMEDGDWLDVYDSNNWSEDYYTDGSPYGKDRFFRGPEVLSSASGWWAYMFVIGATSPRSLDRSTIPVGRCGP